MPNTLKKIFLYLPDKLIDLLWFFEMRRARGRDLWLDALPKRPVATNEAVQKILREAVKDGQRRGYLPAESNPAHPVHPAHSAHPVQ